MNQEPKQSGAPAQEQPVKGALRRFFESTTNQILTAITATIVAAVGAVISPMGDRLRDRILPEVITVNQTVFVTEGEAKSFKVALTDISSGTGLSGGRITITPPDDGVIIQGPTTFTFGPSPGSVDVAPTEGLSVQSRTPGDSYLKVDIQANKGKAFVGQITIRTTTVKPITSAANISGHWRFVANKREGDFDLSENNYRFKINGQFDDGTKVSGSGWRDGVIFRLTLIQADGRAYSTEGIYCEVKNDTGNRFIIVNSKMATSMAGAVMQNSLPLDSIRQRCPRFDDVRPNDGDGAFFAQVPL